MVTEEIKLIKKISSDVQSLREHMDGRFRDLETLIHEEVEGLARMTQNGFTEVHTKIDNLHTEMDDRFKNSPKRSIKDMIA